MDDVEDLVNRLEESHGKKEEGRREKKVGLGKCYGCQVYVQYSGRANEAWGDRIEGFGDEGIAVG